MLLTDTIVGHDYEEVLSDLREVLTSVSYSSLTISRTTAHKSSQVIATINKGSILWTSVTVVQM
jgi:hypothetical protein